MIPRGLSVEPAWARDDFVPELTMVSAPVAATLRGEHVALLERVAAADRELAATVEREGPADRDQRITWIFSGEKDANPDVRAAREQVDAAIVALCEWLAALAEEAALPGELARLSSQIATNDEARRPDVRRLSAFVAQVTSRDVARAVAKVRRAHGGMDLANSAGVAW